MTKTPPQSQSAGQVVRYFARFSLSQRWEHTLLMLSFLVLLLTGLPQKYSDQSWSQALLASQQTLLLLQQTHRIAAVILTLTALYHLGGAIVLLAQRRLPGDMLPTMRDLTDAGQMLKYLLFLSREKPVFGKFNFEQKFTYWFVFFSVAILIVTGFILWFPLEVTRLLPGGVVPAAKLAHSTEAVVTAIFILIWHIYHVHIERLNLSIFTGKMNEEDMQTYHPLEHKRLTKTGQTPPAKTKKTGGK